MSVSVRSSEHHGGAGAVPGAVVAAEGDIELNPGRDRVTVHVENTGDRPVQVGSHFHFADVNASLAFDRSAATGFRLDVPAGTGVRFEPGVERDVTLVRLAGARVVPGLQIRRGHGGGATDPGATDPGGHGGRGHGGGATGAVGTSDR